MSDIFERLSLLEEKVLNLQRVVETLTINVEDSIRILRGNIVRLKNGEVILDEVIFSGRTYNDLTPDQAHEIYLNKDKDYILLDVANKDYRPEVKLIGRLEIPIIELANRVEDIPSKHTPILVISEDGVNSIRACEILSARGFVNVNNVSGGYKFWPKD